jgi:tRNA1Val (adenine37-N6)-methyltransferase
MNPVFRFRQFSINHDRCSMKVGTDGVLLGAYTDVSNATEILDIGTGSGVIAIMLAQRCNARITGVELDEPSAGQAVQNAAACPWHDRVAIVHTRFQDYYPLHGGEYDLVVCNPPFFPLHLKSPDHARNLARHSIGLDHDELIKGARDVLKPSGAWWLILPYSEADRFQETAKAEGFHLLHEMIIIPKTGKKAHRKILSLGVENMMKATRSTLTIRNTDDSYTEEYIDLARDFYLEL